ncbi:toll/interleukin-1 receptor domain-containing protein [Tistrella mobilis]|uniref:toll/interleukin-1 receptor domain-containing protein n=1 Tax=Tistrella mobilis TaxID=171437 RepID=UPI0035570572
MTYDFSSLSPAQFEDFARDLIGRELKIRFEAFTDGPDDGMDGRHATADGDVILQVKHYYRSGFRALKRKIAQERAAIDILRPKRYVLATSVSLTPANKTQLAEVLGPALKSPGDIFGLQDLLALLRTFPDVERAHPTLWQQSSTVMKTLITNAVADAFPKPTAVPPVLAALLPNASGSGTATPPERDTIFIIKSSPIDDEFTLWLAPKLEAEGYRVFADVLTLEPGDRWRREINQALEHRAAKVLLITHNATLDDPSVQDDIDIALDVANRIGERRFILPLRLGAGPKVKGIGDTVAIDFVRGWGEGLALLLEALRRQKVPLESNAVLIDPNWELFRRRGAVPLINEPERLTSNWLRVVEVPDFINYYEPNGASDPSKLKRTLARYPYPTAIQGRGFLSFAGQVEINDAFEELGRFRLKLSVSLPKFLSEGIPQIGLEPRVASNALIGMIKEAWFRFCKARGLVEYVYSNNVGFHASPSLAPVGARIFWGKQGDRRSSMLRNIAKGYIWQYGVTALPATWPFWHLKLKARVLFASDNGTSDGLAIDDPKKMHKLRRSICKGWRNKQWHGRMQAFLEMLSGDNAYITLRLSAENDLVVEASPTLFTSPVSTMLPNIADADDEEVDESTLGRPEADVEETDA